MHRSSLIVHCLLTVSVYIRYSEECTKRVTAEIWAPSCMIKLFSCICKVCVLQKCPLTALKDRG